MTASDACVQGREVAAVSSSAKEAEGVTAPAEAPPPEDASAEAGDEGRPGAAAAAPAPGDALLAFTVQDSIIVDLAALPQARGPWPMESARACVLALLSLLGDRHARPAGLYDECVSASHPLR